MLMRRLLCLLGGTFGNRVAIVQEEVLDLAFHRLRLGHTPTADEIERAVSAIDSGQLDAMLEQAAPPPQSGAPERYADVKPFNHEAWKARHSSK